MEAIYAKALANQSALGVDSAKLVDNLIKHLKSTGKMKLLPRILRELRTLEARKSVLAPSVEVAHESEKAHALKEAKAEGIDAAHATVNHALLSGWRARSGGTLIDRSGKRALIDLYRRIVNS